MLQPTRERAAAPAFLTQNSPAKARYQRPSNLLDRPDAIVVGSGIGGMTIASMLAQKRGLRVLLLEAAATPGGATHCSEPDGWEFNCGIDSVGDMDPRFGRGFHRANSDFLTRGKLEWARMPDVHEVCTFGDDLYQWHSSPEANAAWMAERFPGQGDAKGYYDLEARIEARVWSWVVTKLLPKSVPEGLRERLYRTTGGPWRQYMTRSTEQVLRQELGFSARLASIFSYMFGNYGATPDKSPFALHAINMNHYRDGSFYPVGGPGQIAECILPTIIDGGGQLAVSSPVERILVEHGKAVGVKLATGEEVHCPLVISDVGARPTLIDLLDPEVSTRLGYPARFDALAPSPGHGYLQLGYDEHLELPKHIIWAMASRPGLDPYDLAGADAHWKRDLDVEGMGAYILCPSARDPAYAQRYPNKSTVMVLCETTPEWNVRSRTDAAFRDELNAKLGERLLAVVHRHIPSLRGKQPAYQKAGFPVGCNPRAWMGGSYGLAPTAERFLAATHWTRPQTEIEGLYLTGQDAFAPGFVGAMMGGRVCYSVITGELFNLLGKAP